MFDTRQMEYILAIAEEQNLTRAADRLYLSQSALSQQLKKLRSEGLPDLFEYKDGKMLPTKAGRIYINGIRMILEVNKTALHDIHDPDSLQYPPLRIALLRSVQHDFYKHAVPLFKQAFPSVTLDIQTLSYLNISAMLNENRLDMAVYGTSETHFPHNTFLLGTDEYVLITPPKYIDDISRLPLAISQTASNMYSLQKQAMKQWNIDNPIFAYCNDIDGACSLVQSGLCGCIISKSIAENAADIMIYDELPPVRFNIVVSCGVFHELNLPQKHMIDILKRIFQH